MGSQTMWKDGTRAEEAAERLKMTAPDLLSLGVVDEVVPEPPGAAHQDADESATILEASIERHLSELERLSADELPADRYKRFRSLGAYLEA